MNRSKPDFFSEIVVMLATIILGTILLLYVLAWLFPAPPPSTTPFVCVRSHKDYRLVGKVVMEITVCDMTATPERGKE